MIEIDIPSIDPIQHEPKIFFGLTSRQILVGIPGVSLGALLFTIISKFSIDFAIIGLLAGVAPAILLGWVKPYNMKFEDYAKLVFYNEFINNKKRIYKTDEAVEFKSSASLKERYALEEKKRAEEFEKKKAQKTQGSQKEKK